MCSNALAMIKNMIDTDIANFELKAKSFSNNRKLKEEETTVSVDIAGAGEVDAEGWPTWLSAGDRRLLQGSSVRADATVAANGSGKFKTIAAAVAAAPDNSKKRYVIHIKAGVYRENVEVSKKKKNIMFIGDGRTRTIITGNRNVVDGSTTFHSATVGKQLYLFLFLFENKRFKSNFARCGPSSWWKIFSLFKYINYSHVDS